MDIQIRSITEYTEWKEHFERINSLSFMQSWEWGELYEQIGHTVERLALVVDGSVVGIAQCLKMRSKRGSVLFVPHGPLLKEPNDAWLDAFLKHIIVMGKKEGFWFVRVAPLVDRSPENKQAYAKRGFHDAPLYLTAENSWVLPIEKSEEELLSDMRKTTRYSIRKAEKDGGYIEHTTNEAAVEEFWKLNEITVAREGFTPFPKHMVREEFRAFHKTGNAVFLMGKVKETNELLASALILFTKDSAFYHQGASVHSKIPITYLLQWTAIQEAKKRGCKFYNFWGVASTDDPKHPWAGLTLFKKGFGGHQLDYLPEQDYPLSPLYWFTYIYEKIIRLRRGS